MFRIAPDGVETILDGFSRDAGDGAYPGALVMDQAGNLYVATAGTGGLSAAGTVFKSEADGTLTVLHTFSGGADGAYPNDLIIDPSGNLFGTTKQGGSGCKAKGCGVVFRIDAGGDETVLYNFKGNTDGRYPCSQLAAGGGETILHSFASGTDGSSPMGGVNLDGDGNLYGTTRTGGLRNHGTVYKLAPTGTETILHAFGKNPDGRNPTSNLVTDTTGRLYGTAPLGGGTKCGCRVPRQEIGRAANAGDMVPPFNPNGGIFRIWLGRAGSRRHRAKQGGRMAGTMRSLVPASVLTRISQSR
jgi:uncharacterized repeat protein (TIGR03803 family)